MQSAKINILKIVEEYKRTFPDEYKLVCEAIHMRRKLLADGYVDEDTLDMQNPGAERRALYEIPLTLSQSLATNLTDDQASWFRAGPNRTNRNAGGRWFAKTFPEFSLVEKNKI